MKKVVILLMAGVMVLSASKAWADWFGDYTSSITSSPRHFETQKRGYYSFGSLSTRQDLESHNLFSVQSPDMRIGCGGIDGFWGGFSYLDPEYLVESFQKIMKAAPAFAFKIGLKTMCEQCDNVMTSLQDAANMLNQISLDECGATRALVNAGGNYIDQKMSTEQSKGTNSFTGAFDGFLEQVSSGINNTNQALSEVTSYLEEFYSTQYCGGSSDGVWGDCELTLSFCAEPDSFWRKVGAMENSNGNDVFEGCDRDNDCRIVKFLRGMFGDIYFGQIRNSNSSDFKNICEVVYIAPKFSNNSILNTINNMITSEEGGLMLPAMSFHEALDANSAFQAETLQIEELEFGRRSSENMDMIANAISSGSFSGVDTSQIEEWINQQALPIWRYINTFSYRRGFTGDFPEKDILAQVASVSQAYWILNQVNDVAFDLIQTYTSVLNGPSQVEPISLYDWKSSKDAMMKKVQITKRELFKSYQDVMRQLQTTLSHTVQMSTIEKSLTNEMKKYSLRFGGDM